MDYKLMILAGVLLVVLISIIVVLCVKLRKTKKLLDTTTKVMNEFSNTNKKLSRINEMNTSKYSDAVLEFIHKFSTEISIRKFNTFVDSHNIDMTTKTILEGLVKEISEYINLRINYDVIDYEYTIFTESYVKDYIIETVISTIKDLFNSTVSV